MVRAVVLLALAGCPLLPGNDVPPPDLRCGEITGLAEADGYVFGDAEITSAARSGDEVAVALHDPRGDAVTASYVVDADAPPAIPPLGPALFFSRQEHCFGEGCSDALWELQSADGVGFFEAGALNVYGTSRDEGHLGIRAADADERCGDEPLAAHLVIHADDGDVVLSPDERADVVIAGRPWHAIAGISSRTSFVQDDDDCADCAGVGVHTQVRVEASLYRRAE